MNQGPWRISLMRKKEGQKSRGNIPLNVIIFLLFYENSYYIT
jgi:hypothetical protein